MAKTIKTLVIALLMSLAVVLAIVITYLIPVKGHIKEALVVDYVMRAFPYVASFEWEDDEWLDKETLNLINLKVVLRDINEPFICSSLTISNLDINTSQLIKDDPYNSGILSSLRFSLSETKIPSFFPFGAALKIETIANLQIKPVANFDDNKNLAVSFEAIDLQGYYPQNSEFFSFQKFKASNLKIEQLKDLIVAQEWRNRASLNLANEITVEKINMSNGLVVDQAVFKTVGLGATKNNRFPGFLSYLENLQAEEVFVSGLKTNPDLANDNELSIETLQVEDFDQGSSRFIAFSNLEFINRSKKIKAFSEQVEISDFNLGELDFYHPEYYETLEVRLLNYTKLALVGIWRAPDFGFSNIALMNFYLSKDENALLEGYQFNLKGQFEVNKNPAIVELSYINLQTCLIGCLLECNHKEHNMPRFEQRSVYEAEIGRYSVFFPTVDLSCGTSFSLQYEFWLKNNILNKGTFETVLSQVKLIKAQLKLYNYRSALKILYKNFYPELKFAEAQQAFVDHLNEKLPNFKNIEPLAKILECMINDQNPVIINLKPHRPLDIRDFQAVINGNYNLLGLYLSVEEASSPVKVELAE